MTRNNISKIMPREFKDALDKRQGKKESNLQNPASCRHRRKAGDNYGVSCLDCGTALEGFGFQSKNKTCIHKFVPHEDRTEICKYCEDIRGEVA